MYAYSNELYHHGVKGMKWGVRNDKPTTGRRRSNGYRGRYYQKAVKQSKYNYEHAKSLKKTGNDYDDQEAFRLASKSEQKRSINNAKRLADSSMKRAEYWSDAVKDISNSKSFIDGRRKYKQYKKESNVNYITGNNINAREKKGLSNKQKIAIGVGITAAAAVLTVYGVKKYKANQLNNKFKKQAERYVTRTFVKKNILYAKADESEENWKAFGKNPNSPERYKKIKKLFDEYMEKDADEMKREKEDFVKKSWKAYKEIQKDKKKRGYAAMFASIPVRPYVEDYRKWHNV